MSEHLGNYFDLVCISLVLLFTEIIYFMTIKFSKYDKIKYKSNWLEDKFVSLLIGTLSSIIVTIMIDSFGFYTLYLVAIPMFFVVNYYIGLLFIKKDKTVRKKK